MGGESCWIWQPVSIPPDALEVVLGYWVTGVSSDPDFDNDIFIAGIWDSTFQIEYVDARTGMFSFYHDPMEWKRNLVKLDAGELTAIRGKVVIVAYRLTQDWLSGHSLTSTAYADDVVLYVTRPIYDYVVFLPLVIR